MKRMMEFKQGDEGILVEVEDAAAHGDQLPSLGGTADVEVGGTVGHGAQPTIATLVYAGGGNR